MHCAEVDTEAGVPGSVRDCGVELCGREQNTAARFCYESNLWVKLDWFKRLWLGPCITLDVLCSICSAGAVPFVIVEIG